MLLYLLSSTCGFSSHFPSKSRRTESAMENRRAGYETHGGKGKAQATPNLERFSFAGHVLGMKELADQVRDFFSKENVIPGLPIAPKGSEEERGFMALLHEIGTKEPDFVKASLNFIHKYYVPPPHTGRIGRMAYRRAHQDMMKHILTLPPKTGHMSPKLWLTRLGERLHRGGEAIYPRIKMELEAQGFPFPPEIDFDQHVNNAYMRMLDAKRRKGFVHRLVRNWF
jgi:hypothetical protein